MEVQTRDDKGGLVFFPTVAEAFEHAAQNPDVWKVSFNDESGTRLRFTRTVPKGVTWMFDPMIRPSEYDYEPTTKGDK